MQVQTFNDTVTQQAAQTALREYKTHRAVYDKRDWEIERIYRAISKGKTVISALDAIRHAGVDEKKRPRLALCEAHAQWCMCTSKENLITFGIVGLEDRWGPGVARIQVPWQGIDWRIRCRAAVPRIPPQHRPSGDTLHTYHILWEADWEDIPRDPFLLKRIGADAWVVVAAWDLTAVELSVLRARQ